MERDYEIWEVREGHTHTHIDRERERERERYCVGEREGGVSDKEGGGE